jgi:hypothetical protein
MEVEVTPPDAPSVVTRLLVEETADGPGQLLEVIVQVRGYPPFTVPRKLFEGKERDIGEFQGSYVARRVGERSITLDGKTIPVWDVEATDKRGRQISASVSEQTPPLGIVTAKSEKTDLVLEKWGANAKSRIDGTPMNFYMWLIMRIGQGLVK